MKFGYLRMVAVLALAGGAGMLAPAASAQIPEYYRTLETPQPTEAPGKIELIEFFSYGCPHCAEFAPLLSTWLANLPKDVAFRRVPVGFGRPAWINLQRAYYALQASGDLARLDAALYKAIHEQQLPLFEEPNLAEWVGRNGGNAEKFASAYASFGVNNQTVQADKLAEDYRVEGIPTLAVNGKYVANGNTLAEILANTSRLLEKVRAEQPTRKK